MERHPQAVFHEIQPLRNNKLVYLMLGGGVFLIGFSIYASYEQLVFGRPVGETPISDGWLVVVSALWFIIGAFFVYTFWRGGLVTEVRPDGLHIRYLPFHRRFRHYAWEDLVRYEERQYRPIRDYGGWGLRFGRTGRAYNVSGDRGVLLELRSGTRVLVGSQQPRLLVSALDTMRSHHS